MRKILCAFVIMAAFCGSALSEDFPSSIMNFNDSLTHDEAGNEWTPSGDPVLSSTQSISGGKSLYLDGNSYLQAQNTQPFDLPEEFTLEAWIYPQQFVTDHYGGATFTVFSRWLHGVRTLYLVNIDKVDDNNGRISFYSDFNGAVSVVSESTIPLNKWTHIAVTRDSEKVVRLLVNGKLDGEKKITHDFTSTDYSMTIVASSNAMRKSVGYIDDWHVYKKCMYTNNFTVSHRTESKPASSKNEVYSIADEIRKFKSLLDDGIITQEEFDAAKKKLLGL